jgi:hypothetical protein
MRLTSENEYSTRLEQVYHVSTSRSLIAHYLNHHTTCNLPHLPQHVITRLQKHPTWSTGSMQYYSANLRSFTTNSMLYEAAMVSTKVRCTLSLHQLARKPLCYCHVIFEKPIEHVDRSIRKECPYIENSFMRIWSKLVSHIKMSLLKCDGCYNRLAKGNLIYITK